MEALREPYLPGPCFLLNLPEDIIHLICDKLLAVHYKPRGDKWMGNTRHH